MAITVPTQIRIEENTKKGGRTFRSFLYNSNIGNFKKEG